MRDIEDMLWDLQYEAEKREEECRKVSARVQEYLYESWDSDLKNKNPDYETFTLSELKTIVASRQKDGRTHIEDRALSRKYSDLIYNNNSRYYYISGGGLDTLFYDREDGFCLDPDKWFAQVIENYLRERNFL